MDSTTSQADLQNQLAQLNQLLVKSIQGGQGLAKRITAIRLAITSVEAEIAALPKE